jgi:hypothetical protein
VAAVPTTAVGAPAGAASTKKRKEREAPLDEEPVATPAAAAAAATNSARVRVRSPSPKPAVTVIEQRPLTSVPMRGNRDLPLLQPRGVYTAPPQMTGMFSTAEPTVGNKLPLVHLPPPKLRVMAGMEKVMTPMVASSNGATSKSSAVVGAAAKAVFPVALYPVVEVPVRTPPVPTRARQAFVDAWLDFAVTGRKSLAAREAEKLAAEIMALEKSLFVQSQNAVTYRNLAGQALAKQRRTEST